MALSKLGALWKRTGKSGKTFLAGEIEANGAEIPLLVFKNTYKEEGSKQPDYNIFEPQDSDAESTRPAKASPQNEDDEDTPF